MQQREIRPCLLSAFKGASTCAALYENSATGVIIDNWSWDPSPRDDFYINVKQANIVPRLHIIEKGCWDVNVAQEVILMECLMYFCLMDLIHIATNTKPCLIFMIRYLLYPLSLLMIGTDNMLEKERKMR